MNRLRRFFLGLLLCCLIFSACTQDELPPLCPDPVAIALAGGSCLYFEDDGQLNAWEPLIRSIVEQTTADVYGLLPRATRLTIRVEAGTGGVIPGYGFGGFAVLDEVVLILNPNFAGLEASLQAHLSSTLAHELHHALRYRSQGFAPDLFSFLLNEGMADHFSIELNGGDPPPWSTALQGEELEDWMEEAMTVWFEPPYDYEDWLFGTNEIPQWTGYAIGFELVRRYLEARPGIRVSELIDEPAESFLPM